MTHTLVPEALTDLGDTFRNELAASILVALAQANIPTDVQELLVYGNSMHDIPPGALSKACAVVWRAAIDNIPKLQPDAVKALVEAANSAPHHDECDLFVLGTECSCYKRRIDAALRPFLKEGE